jgi:hypothetical protein
MSNLIKIGFGVQNVLGCGDKHRHRNTQATKAITKAQYLFTFPK